MPNARTATGPGHFLADRPGAHPHTARRMGTTKRRFDYWGLIGTLGAWAVIGTFGGLLGTHHWALDLFAHFRLQYLLFLAPLALVLAVRRAWISASIFGAAALLNLLLLAPAWWPRPAPQPAATRSLLLLNVQNQNHDYARTLALLGRVNPDLVLLMEVSPEWMVALAPLTNALPHVVVQPRADNHGIALYSRFPLRRRDVRYPGEGWVPVIDAVCDVDGRPLRVLGAHPLPPVNAEGTRLRNDLLHALPALVGETNAPTLLAGDLNVTAASRHFHWFCVDTGLRDASLGRGLLGNWPSALPPFLRVRKDHVLASPNLRIGDWVVEEPVGSDHLPLLVHFNLPP